MYHLVGIPRFLLPEKDAAHIPSTPLLHLWPGLPNMVRDMELNRRLHSTQVPKPAGSQGQEPE